ncbi:cytochrome P450 [Wilcoxina mikolae CBS 423.85]|nr:cytochrome P450 [Wilcoxina mikolae CBS 423.85]
MSFEFETSNLTGCLILLAVLLLYLHWSFTSTDIGRIKGIPEIPHALPFVGHLLLLGEDHASTCENLWHRYKHSVFQIRLGNTRAIVVNSFEDCRRMLIGHQSNIIDRPTLYTFHGVISSTQGLTIGSSPWDESCKRKRTAAAVTLGRRAMKNYLEMFDFESYCVIRDIEKDSEFGTVEISVKPYFQRYALNTTLTLGYGIRLDSVYDDMLREILDVGSAISLLRSASENYQDYIPILRYFPNSDKNRRGKELRARRDKYLDILLSTVKDMIQQGIDRPCVSSAVLKDVDSKLSSAEVTSICLSLVSGGFESIPGTLVSCIGSLSTLEGQKIQEKAYEDIRRYCPNISEAWQTSYQEEKVPYVKAIVKEALRYYTITPMIPPRRTTSELNWNGSIIPAKTMILVNAQAANHDTSHFGPTAHKFDPTRWLDATSPIPIERPSVGLQHLSFGGGSRACSGSIIANRLLYIALIRLITSYRIVASEKFPPNTDYIEYNSATSAMVAIPKDFKVRMIPRDKEGLKKVLADARCRSEHSYKA